MQDFTHLQYLNIFSIGIALTVYFISISVNNKNYYLSVIAVVIFSYFTICIYNTYVIFLPQRCMSNLLVPVTHLQIWYFYTFALFYTFILITSISVFFTLMFYKTEMFSFISFIFVIMFGSQLLLLTDSLLLFFLGYELLLLPSFFILYKFAKTYRCVEAAYIMLFWTQLGSFGIIFSLLYLIFNYNVFTFTALSVLPLTVCEVKYLTILLLCGFGVKMPIWPFYGWLPKAHVEAPTNFSIFLSGVLVKLAFFGFIKFLIFLSHDLIGWYLYVWVSIGMIEASQKLFYQTDLKRLIALTTVIEMHWVLLAVLHVTTLMCYAAILMIISHAIISALFFILTDCISRRYKTRLIYEISGLWLTSPNLSALILITNVIFLGFPYTSFFLSEYIFFLCLFDLNPGLFLLFTILLYFINPILIFRAWITVLYGKSYLQLISPGTDLTAREFLIIGFLLLQLMLLGIYPIFNFL